MSEQEKRYAITVDHRELEVSLRADGENWQVCVNSGDPAVASFTRTGDEGQFSLLLNHRSFEGRVEHTEDGWRIWVNGEAFDVQALDARFKGLAIARGGGADVHKTTMVAPMPGVIVALIVAPGDEVVKGQALLTLEAMKMRNDLKSARDGRVKEVKVSAGQTVAKGDVLIVFET